jgi:hypothetical protein
MNVAEDRWNADAAVYLVKAASCGLPLKADEVRLIHLEFNKALLRMSKWKPWNLWADSLPDGEYKPRPSGLIGPEDVGVFFEYCFSPFRNPASAQCVDCDLLKDRKNW